MFPGFVLGCKLQHALGNASHDSQYQTYRLCAAVQLVPLRRIGVEQCPLGAAHALSLALDAAQRVVDLLHAA